MGWIEKAGKIAKGLIPDIKAQVTESGNVTGISVNIENNHYYTNMPEGADAKKIGSTEITPAMEKRIEEEVKRRLLPYEDKFPAWPERERNQFLIDSTSASIVEVISPSPSSAPASKSDFKPYLDYEDIGEGASPLSISRQPPAAKKPFGSDDGETM